MPSRGSLLALFASTPPLSDECRPHPKLSSICFMMSARVEDGLVAKSQSRFAAVSVVGGHRQSLCRERG